MWRYVLPIKANRNPMLYPAELRVPVVRSIIRLGRTGPAAEGSKTGMPAAVLAEIGGGAPVAVVGRGAVIIGKSAVQGAGAVVMEVADRIGQRPVVTVVVPVMARFGQTRRWRGLGQQGGGNQKLGFGHSRFCGSPAGSIAFSSEVDTPVRVKKTRQNKEIKR